MSDAWKEHERRTARALGGKRLGATGRSNEDVDAGSIIAECKHRRALPQWLTDALAKIREHAGAGRLGIVVLHAKGKHDSIVCLSLADFERYLGQVVNRSDGQ